MHSLARPRYDYVDLIRGFSALTVLIVHYRWFYSSEVDTWPALSEVDLPFESLLWPIYAHGNIAVQMFWLLSGFVFAEAYGREGRGVRVAEFTIARVARLYPLHLATLLYLAAIQSGSMAVYGRWTVYGNNDAPHLVAQLFLASNWFTHEGSFNGPIWSVSIEVLVYAAFVVYLKAFGGRPAIAAGIAVTAFAIERATKTPLAMCAALFFGGVVIAWFAGRAYDMLGKAMLAAALGTLGCAVAFVALAALWIGPKAEVLAIYGVLPCVLFAFIAMDRTLPPLPNCWHWIGASTFAIYLLHMPVLITVRLIFPEIPAETLAGPIVLPAFVLGMIGLSMLCYRHFERPMQLAIRNVGGIRISKHQQ
jgi:peptidoglycan/LPS O-acetylase OafA/YrhL